MGKRKKGNNTKESQKKKFEVLTEIAALKEKLSETDSDRVIENLNFIERSLLNR